MSTVLRDPGHAPFAVLSTRFETLRAASRAEPYPPAKVRRDRLGRAIDVLIRNEQRIVDALQADFGGRPEAISLLTDVLAPVRSLRFARRNVQRWMRPERRRAEFPMGLVGGRAELFHQPLGVVGIVAPWNAPVALAFSPLASALAAGNRALIKPSELTPTVAGLIGEMIHSVFGEDEVAVVPGGPDVAQAFTRLPFDHLIFTGSAGIARHVMKAASDNLVPVTLELGGKSPAIVAAGADPAYAARKIVFGKFANAGQVCMAPDFAMVPRGREDRFVEEVQVAIARMLPNAQSNPDFTRVHLPRQRQRLAALLREAADRGARVKVIGGASLASLAQSERFPPVLVVDPPADIALMREEVFGPILPIVPYDTLQQAVQMLEQLPRPLALYFIGGSPAEKEYLLRNTYSGGVTFDDVMLHPFMQDLPFGGVGESGMGRYLGYDGFKALSNGKGVVQRPWVDVSRFLSPPFTPGLSRALRRAIRF